MVKPFRLKEQICVLQLPIPYCVSLMVTIIRYVFINIFQTECFSAVKFAMGYEKNMSFLVIPKSPKVWKKVEMIGLGSFNTQKQKWRNALWEDLDIPLSLMLGLTDEVE